MEKGSLEGQVRIYFNDNIVLMKKNLFISKSLSFTNERRILLKKRLRVLTRLAAKDCKSYFMLFGSSY